jgi:hypothetical protein
MAHVQHKKKPYTLTELSSKLDIDWQEAKKPPKQHEAVGLGRNCYIFHTARHWAYVEIRNIVERRTAIGCNV